ncbi:MAG TPA: helix-turn-helix domain-containing protein [Hymenobacter sp.]|jgi:excisionase family DNA binding protein|uniref:helix-turn-helix domain-containing protein n=1 Tax=Hymenobacter sp. TaxID=1898978 RepID=UPI002ED8CE2E
MKQVHIYELTPQELLDEVRKVVQEEVRKAMASAPSAEEDLHPYTVQETAKLLDCCRQTVHEYVRTGKLRVHKLGARSYFMRADILAALQSESYQRTPKTSRHARR